MNEFVVDTVALVLFLEKRKMGAEFQVVLSAVKDGTAAVIVPAMVHAEILYLSEKGRIKTSLAEVNSFLSKYPACREYPLTLAVVQAAADICDVSELHDRLIAGTTRLLGLKLITNDLQIQGSEFV